MPTASDHLQERGKCPRHVAVLLIIEADLADGVTVFEFIEEEVFAFGTFWIRESPTKAMPMP